LYKPFTTKYHFPSFRRKPESSIFKQLQTIWTPPGLDPGSTGVTTFYEIIKLDLLILAHRLTAK
ncbi:MAG: hypothetical protein KKD12_05755, partial [Proteobacteria bacterium]|nr:hypothetical protein [Pseudomonadota bacterium]